MTMAAEFVGEQPSICRCALNIALNHGGAPAGPASTRLTASRGESFEVEFHPHDVAPHQPSGDLAPLAARPVKVQATDLRVS